MSESEIADSPGPLTDPAITIRGLTVVRGVTRVLTDVDLDIRRGAVTGLLGPSGCGKTTLMRSIVGVQRTVRGNVRVLGESAGAPGLRRRLGYVTQSASVYDELTVRQNLDYFRKVLGAPQTDVDRVIDQVGLTELDTRRVGRLSGGERSRTSLAIAMLGTPELLVLDEPTVGLDPVLRRELWQIFAELAATGVTLLVSSHVMDEASRCDRLILMRSGQILSNSTVPELLSATRTVEVEAAFLALIEHNAA